ncbi:hypothetical protein UCRPC4_g00084 [Phaeomoniella chlamydospora]|uniref:Uncharacterized protein n=1 Tax=Phaeomoniella chlamydospora TaxID=158046 RepID=A0A0G2H1H3_PHACM|nr:hypothetical protein UCRPC4_g00084 [Phaeomoniella chlamydospora]
MSQSGTTFSSSASILSWDEDRSQTTLPRLTPATVKLTLNDLEATVTSNYQMVYLPAGPGVDTSGSAKFIFTDVVEAKAFGGKTGSFITQGKGSFDAATYRVSGQFEVVPGTAQGSLGELFAAGGKGSLESDSKDPSKVNYTFTVT